MIFVLSRISRGVTLGTEEFCNVYCYNKNSKLEWQIKNSPPPKNPEFKITPFVGLYLNSSQELYATDFMGRRFKVNTETGELGEMNIVE